jgi:hypothetical protein
MRGFLAFSPRFKKGDGLLAYEGSATDGPFVQPLGYRRDNITGAWLRPISARDTISFRLNAARNDFTSSGQIPLDQVVAGSLSPFGAVDPTQGGRVRAATLAGYWRHDLENGSFWKADGFLTRSLFDLYSNFTYFLNDPATGDGILQHDSRLIEGANVQYQNPRKFLGLTSLFTAGANYHDNQILVGLDSRLDRTPLAVQTRANARVTNGAGYVQENISLLNGRLQLGAGLRYDLFRFSVRDLVNPDLSGTQNAGRWQPKASAAFTPSFRIPLTIHANYGRGISTADARVIVQRPESTRVANTDFFQLGTSHRVWRIAATTDLFLINRSSEQVYQADDGTFEFQGPSRAYGYEAKLAFEITRKVSLFGGITKVGNAFYRSTFPREYVTNAPHFVANGGITVTNWRGWSASLRMRAINAYRLDSLDSSLLAAGHTVWDLGVSRRIRRGIDFNFTMDNMANRAYWETQNYFESRLPGQDPMSRIHATPGYPRTIMVGLTFRAFGK